jgi:hypothetical protein
MRCNAGVGVCLFAFCVIAVGQQSPEVCKDLKYQDRNQIDYGPLRVKTLRGTVQDPQGTAIPKACVGVFSETDHTSIAATLTDAIGQFGINGIPDGDYRLVVAYEGFSPANVKLQVRRRSRGKKLLSVQMRFSGIDKGSFVELR